MEMEQFNKNVKPSVVLFQKLHFAEFAFPSVLSRVTLS